MRFLHTSLRKRTPTAETGSILCNGNENSSNVNLRISNLESLESSGFWEKDIHLRTMKNLYGVGVYRRVGY
jgi:hypothetical protein